MGKQIWFDAYPDTLKNMGAEKSHQYAFSFESTEGVASCRESYGDAEAILLHLKNVDTPLKAVLNGPADLLRLEVHGPASENAKLKEALGPLGCEFFNVEWGFRNEVNEPVPVKDLTDEVKKPVPVEDLTDNVVTLSPYFKLKDAAKFKELWQDNYKKFAHKEDCVHYAFCFSEDNTRAHCREAYPNAEMVLQHLADVDVPFKAALNGPAELERLEVHGPAAELDKLREALGPLGCLFYVAEWGSRPNKAAMENDTVCHLYPYFQLKKPDEFKQIWFDAYPDTLKNMGAEK